MKHFIRFKTIYPANIVIIFALFFFFFWPLVFDAMYWLLVSQVVTSTLQYSILYGTGIMLPGMVNECLAWQPSQFINIVGKDDFFRQGSILAGPRGCVIFTCRRVWCTEYISLQEMKQGQCICPLERTLQLYWCMMVNVIKGGGRAPPTLTSPDKFYPHDWMYARKQTLLLCVLCGLVGLIPTPSFCPSYNSLLSTSFRSLSDYIL